MAAAFEEQWDRGRWITGLSCGAREKASASSCGLVPAACAYFMTDDEVTGEGSFAVYFISQFAELKVFTRAMLPQVLTCSSGDAKFCHTLLTAGGRAALGRFHPERRAASTPHRMEQDTARRFPCCHPLRHMPYSYAYTR